MPCLLNVDFLSKAELQRQLEDLSAQLVALEAERQQDEEKLTPLIQEIKEMPAQKWDLILLPPEN